MSALSGNPFVEITGYDCGWELPEINESQGGNPERSVEGLEILKQRDLSVDVSRAEEVLGQLFEAGSRAWGLYGSITRETHAPQIVHVPPGIEPGSLEHRVYLALVVMTDRRSQSMGLYERHVELYRRCSWLYGREGMSVSSDVIFPILVQHQIGMPKPVSESWPRLIETIYLDLNGDPLNLYMSKPGMVRGIDDILALKKKDAKKRESRKTGELDLPGFGPKILSLLALFYSELGLMDIPEDACPVDVHVQRLFLLTGAVSAHKEGDVYVRNDMLERIVRKTICQIAKKNDWSIIDLSHYMWFLGNQLCGTCHQRKDIFSACPLAGGYCLGNFNTRDYFKKGLWRLNPNRRSVGFGGLNQECLW